MAEHSNHFRHVLLYEFESGHPAAEAHRNLGQAFGTEALSERSVRAWFQRFKAGNKKLEDEPRSGRPTAMSFDELKDLSEQHPYESVQYFAASLGCSLSTEDDSGDENHLYATKILETIILESGNHAAEVIPTIILTALRRLMKPSEEGLSELRPLLFLVIVAAMYTCTEVSLTYIRQVAEPSQNPLDYICEELVDLNKKFEGIHNRRLALFGICVLFLLPSSTRPAMINTNPKKVLEASLSMFDSLQRALKTQAQARKEDDSRSDESEADSDEEGGTVVKLKKGLRHRKVRSEHLSDDEDEIDEMSLDYIDAVTECKNPNSSDGNGDTDAGSDSAIESSFFEVVGSNSNIHLV
ncbi:hypothetical protein NECAME_09666 [Necator americanus]|uniref:Mos1 transposase HTH domain-containing protein n=1 Tax=Necator americanus TaxID=51031 RepID=W2TF82_NECAM|nr:hypothetical protein NECAME_09666 [Necator americanus]ETN79682.1 hypothetical protein NECAME_09666 [Necator americanus]